MLFAMVYTGATTRHNGCLRVIPGSHRRRHVPHDVLPEAHARAGIAWKGNLDPVALLNADAATAASLGLGLLRAGAGGRHMLGTGCEVAAATAAASFRAFCSSTEAFARNP